MFRVSTHWSTVHTNIPPTGVSSAMMAREAKTLHKDPDICEPTESGFVCTRNRDGGTPESRPYRLEDTMLIAGGSYRPFGQSGSVRPLVPYELEVCVDDYEEWQKPLSESEIESEDSDSGVVGVEPNLKDSHVKDEGPNRGQVEDSSLRCLDCGRVFRCEQRIRGHRCIPRKRI